MLVAKTMGISLSGVCPMRRAISSSFARIPPCCVQFCDGSLRQLIGAPEKAGLPFSCYDGGSRGSFNAYITRPTMAAYLPAADATWSNRSVRTMNTSSWDICSVQQSSQPDLRKDAERSTEQRNSSTILEDAVGARKLFKTIPVHPFILRRIELLGLGIRPRRRNGGRMARQRRKNSPVMDKNEEAIFLAEQSRRQEESSAADNRRNRMPGYSSKGGQQICRKESEAMRAWLPPPPFAPSSNMTPLNKCRYNEEPMGHSVIRRPVKVLKSVESVADEFPRGSKNLPEVALAGRSNVGKSTLLNALLYGNQFSANEKPPERRYRRGKTPPGVKLPKGIKATTSDRPGETRDISFYQLSSQIVPEDGVGEGKEKFTVGMLLADLPGYGFSYASDAKIGEWRSMMKHYIVHRGKSLKRVLLLVDARHGFKEADYNFLSMLEEETYKKGNSSKEGTVSQATLPPIQVVLTKCDLVTQEDLARRVVQVQQQLSESLRREPSSLPVMLVSAKAGLGYNNFRGGRARGGILELQRELASLVPNNKRR